VAVIDIEFLSNGTLVVSAYSSGAYGSPVPLSVTATVSGVSMATPFNTSLPQGNYVVAWGPLPWYETPAPSQTSVVTGRVSYAVGSYSPLVRHVSVSDTAFNATGITAEHGVTPVVWANGSDQDAILECSKFPNQDIAAHQSYTLVFPAAGTYTFYLLHGTGSLTVSVS